ncbi:maltokinase N-terminal cap-like domain-containing protein [Brevibacterium yomogidense]|uniref:Maltokinase N-terminal cap domain-containing protein n=1 Tax=Brevibacterium yomogidense TaxID=946573 RepID=A0A1X6XJH2_9MICO|nr:hypothetical protein [Brevibacterium yomogidense]SLM99454.1 hypothetical protein FM105_11110 [Brevibacterium yomogidense]
MSDIFAADLHPRKTEVVARRLSARFGTELTAADLRMLTSFRFDDPAGEVGCETHIVAVTLPDAGEVVVQVPLTYRGAPLDEAPDEALVTTMDHSVLGERWVYEAAHDPVYVTELLLAITDADGAAEQFLVEDDGSKSRITEGLANVNGTGPGIDPSRAAVDADEAAGAEGARSADPTLAASLPEVGYAGDRTLISMRGTALEVYDVLDLGSPSAEGEGVPGGWSVDAGQLVATWDGQKPPVTLARIVV